MCKVSSRFCLKKHYYFIGSLPFAPCTEPVIWTVFTGQVRILRYRECNRVVQCTFLHVSTFLHNGGEGAADMSPAEVAPSPATWVSEPQNFSEPRRSGSEPLTVLCLQLSPPISLSFPIPCRWLVPAVKSGCMCICLQFGNVVFSLFPTTTKN